MDGQPVGPSRPVHVERLSCLLEIGSAVGSSAAAALSVRAVHARQLMHACSTGNLRFNREMCNARSGATIRRWGMNIRSGVKIVVARAQDGENGEKERKKNETKHRMAVWCHQNCSHRPVYCGVAQSTGLEHECFSQKRALSWN